MVRVLGWKDLGVLRREELFAELLPRVLDGPELTASLARSGGVSVEHLETRARARRLEILGQAREAESAYQQAVSRALFETRLRRLLVTIGLLMLLMLLTQAAAYAWNEALKDALAHHRPVTFNAVASKTEGPLLGLVGITVGVAFALWCASYLLSSDVRAGVPAAKGRQLLITAGFAYFFLAVTSALFVGLDSAEIAWQLVHDRPVEENGGYGWGGIVTTAALLLVPLPPLRLRWLAKSEAGRSLSLSHWMAVLAPRERKQAIRQTAAEWREAVQQALLSSLRREISDHTERVFSTELTISDAPGLKQLRAGHEHVETRADRQLAIISSGMEGGSIALSGPRGVGKTQLLRIFCEGDGRGVSGQLSIVEPVPVLFDRREFMLHLFYKLCDRVIQEGLDTAQEAARHQSSIRYLQTHSDEAALSAGWRSWSLSAKRATSLAQQPQTYPEIVDSLKRFLGRTALELDEHNRRLVIGIDELDRIEPAATARTFLNELKAVFDVPKCLFVLSVSDEALREAELAPVGRRDAFDSAIDEIIRVEPLDQRTAEKLLSRRVVGLPVPFTALFHCMSGGMPRDLLRTARAAISYATYESEEQSRSLAAVAASLVNRERDRIANAAGGPAEPAELAQLFRADVIAEHGGLGELGRVIHEQAGTTGDRARMGATLANRAYHLDTVLRFFTTDLDRDRITRASAPAFAGSFAALARAQREIGTADTLARSTLQRFRSAWSLPVPPAIPPV